MKKGILSGLAAISLLLPSYGVNGADSREHVIQKGDTFYSLARDSGSSLEEVIAANPGVDPKRLQIGQKIKIPGEIKPMQDSGNYVTSPNNLSVQLTSQQGNAIKERGYNTERTEENGESSLAIIDAPSPNYRVGRKGGNIEGIVIHSTEGSGNGALEWLKNPVSNSSAHYLIMEDGQIYRLVADTNTAWHVGPKANYNTIGVEWAGYAHKEGFRFTDNQYKSGGSLISYLMEKHNLDAKDIVSHKHISETKGGTTHTDPGKNFDWEKLRENIR